MIICKESPLSQRKTSLTHIACITRAWLVSIRQYSSVRSLCTCNILIVFRYFRTLKIIFLLKDCKFAIRNVCSTPSNIDDRSFCDNSMQHSFKVVRFSCKKVHVRHFNGHRISLWIRRSSWVSYRDISLTLSKDGIILINSLHLKITLVNCLFFSRPLKQLSHVSVQWRSQNYLLGKFSAFCYQCNS